MNRPQKVNQVYREFRSEVGDEFPAHELLRSAAKLIEIIQDDGPITGARPQEPRATFDERPVDEVIADGGWKLLSRESSWFRDIDGDDALSVGAKTQLHEYGLEIAA